MYTMMTWSVENILKGSQRMNNLCMTEVKKKPVTYVTISCNIVLKD